MFAMGVQRQKRNPHIWNLLCFFSYKMVEMITVSYIIIIIIIIIIINVSLLHY